jgi:hypothetical protein
MNIFAPPENPVWGMLLTGKTRQKVDEVTAKYKNALEWIYDAVNGTDTATNGPV